MLLDVDECQLVLVDYQEKLMPAMRDGEQVVAERFALGPSRAAAGGANLGRPSKTR